MKCVQIWKQLLNSLLSNPSFYYMNNLGYHFARPVYLCSLSAHL